MGLKVGIWASTLEFEPQGWDMGLEAEIWAWRLWGGGYEEEGSFQLKMYKVFKGSKMQNRPKIRFFNKIYSNFIKFLKHGRQTAGPSIIKFFME